MKKIITLLFSFILLFSLTACSESPEKLFGYYKSYNEEHHDYWGRVETLRISQDEIYGSSWDVPCDILKISKENDYWLIEVEGLFRFIKKFKKINNDIIEEIDDNKVRKFIKITEEEYKKLQEKPRSPMPSLFN